MGRLQYGQLVIVGYAAVIREIDVRHREQELTSLPAFKQGQFGSVRLRCHRVQQHGGGNAVAVAYLALFHGVLGAPRHIVRRGKHLVAFPACRLQSHAGTQRHRVPTNGVAKPLEGQHRHFLLLSGT